MFRNKYSPYTPILIMIDWKLGPIYRILYFYLMRSYTGNLPQSWKFVTDNVTKKYKNWRNCGFKCGIFLKVIFSENVSVNKIKFHKIRPVREVSNTELFLVRIFLYWDSGFNNYKNQTSLHILVKDFLFCFLGLISMNVFSEQ